MNKFQMGGFKPPKSQQEDPEKPKTPIIDTEVESLQRDTPTETQKFSDGTPTSIESDHSIEKGLDQLHNALDNRTIKNSDGVDVTLHVTREKLTKTSEEVWYVTFDYEYNGRLINRKYPQTDNYIKLSVAPETHTVTVDMAQLETQILKGKNVYPQVMQLLGESFPDNFGLEAEFGHEETKKSIVEARDEYQQGQIGLEQFKQKILQSYLFRNRIASGFNHFELSFSANSSGEITLNVKSRKDETHNQPELIILGL